MYHPDAVESVTANSTSVLRLRPLTLLQANAVVAQWHRHHKPVRGHRFSIGVERDGQIVGAVIVGRPVARMTPQYDIAEVTRLVTNGSQNACSKLYSAAARAAEAMGYTAIQTFILQDESGTSLKAAGWIEVASSTGGDWNRPSRSGRRIDQPMIPKRKFERRFY